MGRIQTNLVAGITVVFILLTIATAIGLSLRSKMSQEILSKSALLDAVIKSLNPNFFTSSPCPAVFKGDPEIHCFASHLDYQSAINVIASAVETYTHEPKKLWNHLGTSWSGEYQYILDKNLTIGFGVSSLDLNYHIPEELPFYKDFSTYIDLKIYEEK